MNKTIFKAFLLAGTVAATSSCSLMLPDRSFIDEMNRESDAMYTPGVDFPVVSGDTGEMRISKEELKRRTPASARSKRIDAEALSLSQELSEKESRLSEEELAVYESDKKFLQTDSDKLYYLSLSPYDKKSYISTKKSDLEEDLNGSRRDIVQTHSIHSGELSLGMAKADVLEIWGKPAKVEIAGNPSHQNERWSFVEDGSVKQVYFEGGRVQGWALDL